jgi:3-oxoacyl-(acyl-carrier-protein) synthase
MDPFDIDPTGTAAADALNACLVRSAINPTDLDYICANANSLASLDRKEASTIKRALGEFAARVPTSSIKGVIGHPFGAAAAFQLTAVCLAMRDGVIPPTANLKEVDPACNLNLVMGEKRMARVRHALVSNHGFGGLNAYLAVRHPSLIPVENPG